MAREKNLGFFTTVNPAIFNDEQLSLFDVIIFNNVTGDALSSEQEAAFQRALENGTGWIGLHGSGDASHDDWPWYRDSLIGPVFIGHPARDEQFQEARVVNLQGAHPVMAGIPPDWLQIEEWYSFDDAGKTGSATILAGLDEDSYAARNIGNGKDLRMGGGPAGHPVIWVRCVGKGRAFYSAMGHWPSTYDLPVYRQILYNAFDWVADTSTDDTEC